METLKNIKEIMEPDHRSTVFGMINLSDGTSRNMTLADFYKDVESVRVNEGAPEDVRSYMEAVKTLFAYGWFYYPFYMLSAFLATTAVEMALRAKLPKFGEDYRGLGKLFEQAISQSLLRDEDFPSREHIQANRASVYGENSRTSEESSTEPERPYVERVAKLLTYFRNVFAHPSYHAIFVPGQALDFLVLAGEVINQLWPSRNEGAKV